MASDVDARTPAVSKWWQRDSIPAERWSAILATEQARSAGVTSDTFIALAARETSRACA
jgi:hypothetical protein